MTTKTLEEMVAALDLGFEIKSADSNPNIDDDKWAATSHHWLCTLTHRGRKMDVPFSQGSAHTKPPTLADVLDCLASDASGYENARTFEEWYAEYGYDPDSRRAERTFRVVQQQATRLFTLLGRENYDALLWKTERL